MSCAMSCLGRAVAVGVFGVLVSVNQPPATAQVAAPVTHVVTIATGPAGSEVNGRYLLTERRSSFNRAADREVIVLFEWDGAAGKHKLAATWRAPDGAVISTSPIDYVARDRRFGAYWRLTLSPTAPLGSWTVEATVDGEPAGRQSFDVTDTAASGAAVKRPLLPSEVYERLAKIFVPLRRMAPSGTRLDSAAAFVGPGGRVYTSATAIDDVDRIVARMPDGSERELTHVLSFSRRQDWALLDAGGTTPPEAVLATEPAKVGDRCYAMDGSAAGEKVIVEGTISGQRGSGTSPLLLATFMNGYGTPGAPVFNEYGELIGMVGAGGVPGAGRLDWVLRFRAELKGAPIVSVAGISVGNVAPRSMTELRSRGLLIPALSGDENVMSGGFARGLDKSNAFAPVDQRWEFSMKEPGFVVFLTWNARQRTRGMTILRIYDGDSDLVAQSKPAKVDVRKGDLKLSSWQVPMVAAAGVYRADLFLDDKPIWRGFVRITE